METDVLHRLFCSKCHKTTTAWGPMIVLLCPHCNEGQMELADSASTVGQTVGSWSVGLDSIDTLDQDVAAETERIEIDRDLRKAEKARRGIDVEY